MPSARTECVLNVSGATPRPKAPREECIPTPGKERSQLGWRILRGGADPGPRLKSDREKGEREVQLNPGGKS